jgi:hemolysin activation/secretion protein
VGAEQTYLVVGDIVVDGLDPAFAAKAQLILDPLRGARAPISVLYGAAFKIQAIYAEHGYFLTRVVIPPQVAHDHGRLIFKVAEGYIAKVDVSALAPAIRDRAAAILAPLIGLKRLKRADFIRALRLASDTPGLQFQSNLSPAHADLGVTLTVSGAFSAMNGQITFDNSMPRSLGGVETTVAESINSPFGGGEQLYYSASAAAAYGGFGPNNPRRMAAVGLIAPVLHDGLNLNLEYAWSATNPFTPVGQIATDSLYQRASLKIKYPWIEGEKDGLSLRLAIDNIDEINQASAFSQTLYHDHLNVARFGLDVHGDTMWGAADSVSLDISQGVPALGARGAGQATIDEPISRAGASDAFTKLEAHARLRRDFWDSFTLDLSSRGQLALRGPLMNSEKFVIGGPDDLSGFDAGSFSGDSGWATRAEWQYRLPTKRGPSLTPYVFAARGQVFTMNPTAAEVGIVGAESAGLGLRATLAPSSTLPSPTELGLEAARDVVDHQAPQAYSWRINLSASLRF